MCGILGSYPACSLRVEYLRHRGPDGSGIQQAGDVVFGHTRLAILDLSEHGAQPKWSAHGDVLITYNGEIYNYRTLGWPNETCDTAALAEWLAREGPSFEPARLDGMYAFAAYFVKERCLVLARDPVGIKPLYVALSPDGSRLAFSSEVKGLFGVEWFKPSPNHDVSVQQDFLQYGYTGPKPVGVGAGPFRRTIPLVPSLLNGVYQLCPGQKLVLSPEREPRSTFAQIGSTSMAPLAALQQSVAEQSMSDVEVGVQMSGGIDSSLVSYHYALHNRAVHGFYVSVRTRETNEDRWAHHAARALEKISRFTFHQINATEAEVRRVLPRVVWHMDEPPIRHPNAIGVYLLCEYVRKSTRVEVLLTGEGADEIFAGYEWHDGRSMESYDLSRRLFDFGGSEWVRGYTARFPGKSVLERQLLFDRDLYLPPILMRQDRMSMAHSIEARVPFLSNRFLGAPPPSVAGKQDLKDECARLFGRRFAHRPKCGFAFPQEWLGKALPPEGSLDWLREIPRAHTPMQRWALAALGLWARDYLLGGWADWLRPSPHAGTDVT